MLFNLLVSNANNKTTPDTPDTPDTPELPAGFTQLDYLVLTGEQYFTLPYYANHKTIFTIDFKSTAEQKTQCLCHGTGTDKYSSGSPREGFSVMFKAPYNTTSTTSSRVSRSTEVFWATYGLNKTIYLTLGELELFPSNKLYEIERMRCVFGKSTVTAYNMDTNQLLYTETNTNSGYDAEFISDVPLTLLYRDAGYSKLTGRFYCASVAEDDVMIYDLIPVINPDGIAGVFDLVGQVFYRSEGAADFAYE